MPDEPQSLYRGPHTVYAGFYRVKMNKRGAWVAAEVRIADGMATAYIDGELATTLDSWKLDPVDRIALWGERVTESEHTYLLAVAKHARQHNPAHPAANPQRPIDLRLLPPIYQRRAR